MQLLRLNHDYRLDAVVRIDRSRHRRDKPVNTIGRCISKESGITFRRVIIGLYIGLNRPNDAFIVRLHTIAAHNRKKRPPASKYTIRFLIGFIYGIAI